MFPQVWMIFPREVTLGKELGEVRWMLGEEVGVLCVPKQQRRPFCSRGGEGRGGVGILIGDCG